MSTNSHPFVREMMRQAVEALGSPTTNVAVRDWIEERYPGTNRGTIQAQRIVCTVNQPSRVHYPENRRPRLCDDTRYDFLFCSERGKLEWCRLPAASRGDARMCFRCSPHGDWRQLPSKSETG